MKHKILFLFIFSSFLVSYNSSGMELPLVKAEREKREKRQEDMILMALPLNKIFKAYTLAQEVQKVLDEITNNILEFNPDLKKYKNQAVNGKGSWWRQFFKGLFSLSLDQYGKEERARLDYEHYLRELENKKQVLKPYSPACISGVILSNPRVDCCITRQKILQHAIVVKDVKLVEYMLAHCDNATFDDEHFPLLYVLLAQDNADTAMIRQILGYADLSHVLAALYDCKATFKLKNSQFFSVLLNTFLLREAEKEKDFQAVRQTIVSSIRQNLDHDNQIAFLGFCNKVKKNLENYFESMLLWLTSCKTLLSNYALQSKKKEERDIDEVTSIPSAKELEMKELGHALQQGNCNKNIIIDMPEQIKDINDVITNNLDEKDILDIVTAEKIKDKFVFNRTNANCLLAALFDTTNLHEIQNDREKQAEFSTIIKFLLAQGAYVDVHFPNKEGVFINPLHKAVIEGNDDVVELLLKHGADPDMRDSNGECPIFKVTSKDRWCIASLLWKYGLNPDLVNSAGMTAFAYLSMIGLRPKWRPQLPV